MVHNKRYLVPFFALMLTIGGHRNVHGIQDPYAQDFIVGAGMVAVDGTAGYLLNNEFITSYEDYLFKKITHGYKKMVNLLENTDNRKNIRKFIEKHHTFLSFSTPLGEQSRLLALACGKAAFLAIAETIASTCSTAVPFGGRLEAEGPYHLLKVIKSIYEQYHTYGFLGATGRGFLNGCVLGLVWLATPKGAIQKSAVRMTASLMLLKIFNDMCRECWFNHVIDNKTKLRNILENYAIAKAEKNREAYDQAKKDLKQFISEAHESIGPITKIIM